MQTDETKQLEKLLELDKGLFIARVHIDMLREQDLNARVMTKEMFDQLAKNIKNHGYMESLPYCAETERGIEIISGHHRVRACRTAGITQIYILLDTNGLARDEIIARQLAHNSLSGVDDREMVKRLFESINDVDLRLETFIAPRDLNLDLNTQIALFDIAPNIDFKVVSITFLPYQLDNFNEVIKRLNGNEVIIGVAERSIFDKFKIAVMQVQKTENIKSIGMAIARMSEIVLEQLNKKNDTEQ